MSKTTSRWRVGGTRLRHRAVQFNSLAAHLQDAPQIIPPVPVPVSPVPTGDRLLRVNVPRVSRCRALSTAPLYTATNRQAALGIAGKD
jgi:hypothetical protein